MNVLQDYGKVLSGNCECSDVNLYDVVCIPRWNPHTDSIS